jgi:L-ascorbate metabolism protein UlaG (beta-lactamase superfamily)
MQISWLGDAGIRLQMKDTIVLLDPPASRPVRAAAQIVAITMKDGRDWKSVGGEPLLIDTPGEFERAGIFVYGLNLASEPARVHFRVEGEELSLGHLGNLDHRLENGEIEPLEGVDVLFIPVGGHDVLTAAQATDLITQLEPRIVIPIQFQTAGLKSTYDPVEPFLKAIGAKNVEPVEKFKIDKKSLPADDTQTVILLPS